jgi:hypothetical protein
MTPGTGTIVIGLGGQRCGSSWLHEMLSRHPEIQPAAGEKETHFFDRNWDRGTQWYFGLWPDTVPGTAPDTGPGTRLRWESTPSYLYYAQTRDRIAATVPAARFVVLLRDPVGRSLSHYRRLQVNHGSPVDFDEALVLRPSILTYSAYAEHLEGYFDTFGRENVFVGFYEDIARQPATLTRQITEFLGIAPVEIPSETLERRVNAVRTPRNALAYGALYKTKRWLQKRGLDGLVDRARKMGIMRLVTSAGPPRIHETIGPVGMDRLVALRDAQIEALGRIGIDASRWAQAAAQPRPGRAAR